MPHGIDYHLMLQAAAYLRQQQSRQPALADVAAALGISGADCQRLFKRYSNASAERVVSYLMPSHAKTMLCEGVSDPPIARDNPSSNTGQQAERRAQVTSIKLRPTGQIGAEVEPLRIEYGTAATPFGTVFLASSHLGLCNLRFIDERAASDVEHALETHWGNVQLEKNDETAETLAADIFSQHRKRTYNLLLQGSQFQLRVWQALLDIPQGTVTSYGRLAAAIGCPGAARAVGRAVGDNPIAWLIPCHRVIRADGGLGGYRWGLARKQLLLACETFS